MKKFMIYYLILILFPVAVHGMEFGSEFLKTCLDHEVDDLPSHNLPKKLVKLYRKKISLEMKDLDIKDDQWARLVRQTSCYEKCSDLLEKILEKGVNPNFSDIFGGSPLYYACSAGCAKNVALLLKYKADPNLRSCSETMLMAAVQGGSLKVITLLLQQKDIEVNAQRYASGNTAIMLALEKSRTLNDASKEDQSLRRNIVLALLDAGADPSITEDEGKTAIDIARENGFDGLAELMENYSPMPNLIE